MLCFVLFCVFVWLNAAVGKEQAAKLTLPIVYVHFKNTKQFCFSYGHEQRNENAGRLGTRVTLVLALAAGGGRGRPRGGVRRRPVSAVCYFS